MQECVHKIQTITEFRLIWFKDKNLIILAVKMGHFKVQDVFDGLCTASK